MGQNCSRRRSSSIVFYIVCLCSELRVVLRGAGLVVWGLVLVGFFGC